MEIKMYTSPYQMSSIGHLRRTIHWMWEYRLLFQPHRTAGLQLIPGFCQYHGQFMRQIRISRI